MDSVRIIEVKRSIFDDNDKDAEKLRTELKNKGVFLLNLMSSPGSGKTTTLIKTINLLKNELRIGVMEADIDSDVDAKKIVEATGVHSTSHWWNVPSRCRYDSPRLKRIRLRWRRLSYT